MNNLRFTSFRKAFKALTVAVALCLSGSIHAQSEELTEGYYRIISAGNGTGYYTGDTPPDVNYNYEGKVAWYNDGGLVRWATYDPNDYSMIYQLKKDDSGAWLIFNLRDQSYVEAGTKSYGGQVSASSTPTAQELIAVGGGKWMIKAASSRFIYSMTASHNGLDAEDANLSVWGTTEEGARFGVNLWYVNPVPEEVVSYLRDNDMQGTLSIATDPEAPQPGKKYVIKNATADFYITSEGGMTNLALPEKPYFWQIEASGRDVDGYPTYFLKSVDKGAYWQHIDYAAKRWDDGNPYDAYDWYDYAGLNAEMGPATTAMEVTVLAASSTATWRSEGATSGYVLAMRDPVVANKTYYYKLGHQDNNVGMEPWNEGVGWLFYPVSDSNDAYEELQNTIDAYGAIATADLPLSPDPGFYSPDKVEAYLAALESARQATRSAPRTKLRQLSEALKTAAEALQQPNPINEGYYYIVTAGNGTGYYTGDTPPDVNYNFEFTNAMYNEGDLVYWKAFDPDDFNQIYHFYPDGNGNWFVQSALNATYINKGTSTYSTKISTTLEPTTAQVFEPIGQGKFTVKPDGNPYVYSMAATHNGSTNDEGTLNIWGSYSEAVKFGVNVWYVKAVSAEVMEEFNKTDAGLMALCAKYEAAISSMPTDEEPGFYFADNVQTLRQTIATARERATTTLTDEEKAELRQQLETVYNQACEVRPLTDGYYYLVSNYEAYRQTFGNYPAIYTTALSTGGNTTACYYDTFDPDNANYIYKVSTTDEPGTFQVQNAYTLRYLNTGEGTGHAGGVFTSTPDIVNSQIARWHSAGKFWMADQQASDIGHTIANPSALNKRLFIVGGTSFTDNIPADLSGYNTWSFIPLTESQVATLIATQRDNDARTLQAYNQMVSYADEINAAYQEIITDQEGLYNSNAVTMLKSRHSTVQSLVSIRPYDIATPASTYAEAEADLRDAYQAVLTTKPDTTSNQQLTGIPIGAVSVDYTTSQPSTTANLPAEAFDNDYTTIYAAYDRSTGWVGLDLGQKYVIDRIAYAPRAGWASRMVLGIFEGANEPDFSDAMPFYMIRTAPEYEQLTSDTVLCTRGFRYVRYIGPNESRCNVSELRFYGHPGRGDDSQLLQLTNLPTVIIRTQANVADVTSKSTWLPGMAYVISDGGTAFKGDTMTVRGRGNGSWTFPKKPYKLKFAGKTRLLDMPAKAREWTLINNYGDKTLIRNAIAFEISRIFEMDYTPALSLVDVIFNGQYKGSYQLCDQVEVRKNRVDITEMTPDDNEGEALTGGYLIELDAYAGGEPKRFTSNPYSIPVTVHYPKHDEITDQQFSYIVSTFNDLCARVFSKEFKDPDLGYSALLAEDTWLKYFLIAELSGNTDSYWSVYLTKDRNGKFRVSPIWDFDLAFDNDRRTHPILTMNSYLSLSSKSSAASGVRSFNRKIIDSCTQELKELWSWYRYNGNLNPDNLHDIVDYYGELNNQSQELNYTRWDILNTCTQQQYTTRGSYKAEVDFIYEYLSDRIYWMDNMVGLEEPIGIHNAQADTEAHGGIHGHEGYILVRGFAPGSTLRVYSPGGTLTASAAIQDFDNRLDLSKGIYIVRVTEPDGHSTTQKVAVR